MPNPGPGEVPAAAAAPRPAVPEVAGPPPRQARILVAETSGQHFQDPAPAELPKLYPPLRVSSNRKGRETLELSRDCTLPAEKAMAPNSSTLAWNIPWMEETGRLKSMGLLRVRHD